VKIGERAAQQVLELDPENAAGYVLVWNTCICCLWQLGSQEECSMTDNGKEVWQNSLAAPGLTWVDSLVSLVTFWMP
jgi:hypothetical protein